MQSSKKELSLRGIALAAVVISIAAAFGCGGGSSSSKNTGGGSNTQVIAGPGPNVVTLTADAGANGQYFNGSFVSVQVCVPGTTTCQTIDHLLVDTGSFGLRLLHSSGGGELTLALPQEKDASNNPIGECVQFVDGSFLWGPVGTADITISSEKASSVPVQIVGDSSFTGNPATCSGTNDGNISILNANGILGVGNIQQDCPLCAPGASPAPLVPAYYTCPSGVCTPAFLALAQQVQNPVALFPTDNNGVIVELPPVGSSGAVSTTGALVFGIGTQTNNALGSASVQMLPADPTQPDFLTLTATYKGVSYPGSFIDSGSNALFFLDSSTTGMSICSLSASFYCPSSTQNFTATNQGTNTTTTSINFSIANLQNQPAANVIFSNVGGPNPNSFDWGLPFFMGRNVFVSIAGKTAPGGTPPYVAY